MEFVLMFCPQPEQEEVNVCIASYPEIARVAGLRGKLWEHWARHHAAGRVPLVVNRLLFNMDVALNVRLCIEAYQGDADPEGLIVDACEVPDEHREDLHDLGRGLQQEMPDLWHGRFVPPEVFRNK